ncbi:MAG: hypothetical protein A3K19_31530 [Lentisphaerae bacterium RIFOXYB12_FULL_65_16]|nr:MAG: hypothetical protein A3K18_27605 [Lentisphaerae bacterium RIFOXYA12_64_32]OGV88576.1 MAG: hypothetical protein A3K19_31530 [Lentisphaerae bacterium RIFOXYB12_FULL_65_16]
MTTHRFFGLTRAFPCPHHRSFAVRALAALALVVLMHPTLAADPTIKSGDGLALTLSEKTGTVVSLAAGSDVLVKPGDGTASGFLVEDIGRKASERALAGTCTPQGADVVFAAEAVDAGLALSATFRSRPTHIAVAGELRDTTGDDRAIVLTFALPLDVAGWTWGDDIRRTRPLTASESFINKSNTGEGGSHSIYPFSCLTSATTGLCCGIPLDKPIICRLSYNGPKKRYEITFDLGLSQATKKFPGRAAFQFILYRSDPGWGFRAAAKRFYEIYPDSFTCRPKQQGIWMPFTRISTIEDFEDFGFMFMEGAPEVGFDDKIGVYDFVYVEPWSIRLYLPPGTKGTPTPDEAMTDATVKQKQATDVAHAQSCATTDKTGAFNTRSYLASWAPGSKCYDFTALPDPEIPGETKASHMDKLIFDRFKKEEEKGSTLDGVYFDGFGEWVGELNYRKELWTTADFPLAFSWETRRPVQVYAFGVYEYVAHMDQALHPKGKLLMANGYLWGGYPFTAHWLDVCGNEIHWTHQRADLGFFDYRRTLAYHRPYLPLDNEDFEAFKCAKVEEYFQKCLFWGFFPSMFSPGASSFGNFWQTPEYHNRERPLFRTYVPLIRRLSEAGWEPVTFARASAPDILVERFGANDMLHITCNNPGAKDATFDLTVEADKLNLPADAEIAADLVSGRNIPVTKDGTALRFSFTLPSENTAAFWITSPKALARYYVGRAQDQAKRARDRLVADKQAKDAAMERFAKDLGPAVDGAADPQAAAGMTRAIGSLAADFAKAARPTRPEKIVADLAEAELLASRATAALLGADLAIRPDARLVQGRRSKVAVTVSLAGAGALDNCSLSLALPDGYSARPVSGAKPAKLAAGGTLETEFHVQTPFTADIGGSSEITARLTAAAPDGTPVTLTTRRAVTILVPCEISLVTAESANTFNLTFRNHADDILQGYVSVKPPVPWQLATPLKDVTLQPREVRTEPIALKGPTAAPGIYSMTASMLDLARLPIGECTLDFAVTNADRNLLKNAGFEDGTEPPLPAGPTAFWEPYATGYGLDTTEKRSGQRSIVAILGRPDTASIRPAKKGKGDSVAFNVVESPTFAGASCEAVLNQKEPRSLFIVAWSKAEEVSGSADNNYSIYVDLHYQDGTPLWGQIAPFTPGTHGWEQKSLLISPEKPIKDVKLYLLFRNHTGKVWFDDVFLGELGE